jgi:transcriptional regulator with XRE-family HTH domain
MTEKNAFEVIKEKLNTKQLTIKKLAEDTGISTDRIYKWVSPSKKATPKIEDYKLLEEYLNKLEKVPNTGVHLNPLIEPENQEPQPTTNKETPMGSIEQKDWKQAHDVLLNSQNTMAESNLKLSQAVLNMTELLKRVYSVDTNLSTAIKDQEAYHNSLAVNQEIIFGALDDILHLPSGTLAQKASNVRHVQLESISKKDSVGS